MKTEFKLTNKTREIHSILILLSKVMPLISKSIKSQASKCTPPDMNPTYVRSRMQSTCNPLEKTGVERLQLLLKDIFPKEDAVIERKQQPKREKTTLPATVSPNKSNAPLQPSSKLIYLLCSHVVWVYLVQESLLVICIDIDVYSLCDNISGFIFDFFDALKKKSKRRK